MFKSIKERLLKKKLNKQGFTLVELIIVIIILVVLAAIAIPATAQYVGRANEAKVVANARSVYMGASTMVADGLMTSNPLDGEYLKNTSAMTSAAGLAGIASTNLGDGTKFNVSNGAVSVFIYEEDGITVTRDFTNNSFNVRR